MESKTLRTLEFDKVTAMLAAHSSFSAGRFLCDSLLPKDELSAAEAAQAETSEARSMMRLHPSVPLGGITDVRDVVKRAAIGVVLDPPALLAIADTVAGARRLKKVLSELGPEYPILRRLADQMLVPGEVENAIRHAIMDSGEISDNASPELSRIRRSLRATQSRIRDRMENLIRSSEAQRYLQDPIVTLRNGRFVVPVKAEMKALIPGIVHDQSGSGATLFVEPMASVEANNEIRRLEFLERDEIERIMEELSRLVGGARDAIVFTVDALAQADFVFAKARLSMEMEGNEPRLTDDYKLDIRNARHPLLKGDVVPVDIRLGQDFDTLLITGPNTGGKTVTLKTAGLLTLMAQAGLHIPASGSSRVSVFHEVFADIGDEQSIEQSLSTFSSHMKNIVEITGRAGNGCMVLLDEIGAGTDPQEGSRLAMALLEYLHAVGCKTIATTHYSELKSFAYLTPRVENASVEFDVETLRPTYRLSIGLPGKSNAFEIARRLGLPDDIIGRAKELLSEEHFEVERLIGEIQASKFKVDEEQRKAFSASAHARELEVQYEAKLKELKTREKEIIERARSEALSLTIRVKAECEAALKRVRHASAMRPNEVADLQREVREGLREARTLAESQEESLSDQKPAGEILREAVLPGTMVYVKSLKQKAEVIDRPDGSDNVTIRVGIIRTQVPVSDLAPAEADEKKKAREEIGKFLTNKVQTATAELMLIGMTTGEAVDTLDKYLDNAVLGGLKQVRIVHGKGTGALRKAVQESLKGNRSVISHRLGAQGEGGDGVTIAVLQE